MFSLANTPLNHLPSVVNTNTTIPLANIFKSGYYWVDHPSLIDSILRNLANRVIGFVAYKIKNSYEE
jgi:hypothetical protein